MDSIATTEDLVYIGSNHVYELWYNGLWHPADLTTASGAPANADSTSGIRVMMNTIANATEANYIGTDHNVYSLRYPLGGGGVWNPTNLTTTLGTTPATAGSPLTSGLNTVANTFDVEFVGIDQHVYRFWFNGTWHITDLTTTAP
jgi:hypothetical protein